MPCRRLAYARAILGNPRYVRTRDYEMALVAIMASENSQAQWNPLDTTEPWPGATPYNSFGTGGQMHVWNYPNARAGVLATVTTMGEPVMGKWSDLFKTPGHSAEQVCQAYATVPWSSIGNTLPLQLVRSWRRNPLLYLWARRKVIPGKGPWPYNRLGKLIG